MYHLISLNKEFPTKCDLEFNVSFFTYINIGNPIHNSFLQKNHYNISISGLLFVSFVKIVISVVTSHLV